MKSYAQNYEDVILWQALQDVQNGFYIDVGAGHPEEISVTKAFYDMGWHGINVEPHGELFQLLKAARPRDINLNVAAGSTNGLATFYYFDRMAGFVANRAEIRAIFEAHGHTGHEARLGQLTLTQILADYPHPEQIHFLKIDVEGYEKEVLEGLDLKRYRPWIILAEATIPSTTERVDYLWAPILLGNYYRFLYFDGLNSFFAAEEHMRNLKTSWHL